MKELIASEFVASGCVSQGSGVAVTNNLDEIVLVEV